ncbi:MAG TPA: ABC transporter permease subunit [Gemmataceae bacterium]|nr:ABC transporter permease subunit [Gemmataceae bacterium]
MLGPIFNREGLTLPRRARHYFTRSLYVGGLWILMLTIWQVTVGWQYTATLGDLARFGLMAFRVLTFVQLTLLLFFSALSAASTVSLEKDRRTFLLLLITDLSNHEIVLGKLLGSLLQILLMLVGSIPVFALLMLLGGIDPWQIGEAMLVLATAALAAGSLGGLVALWRDKTFQALAMTVLFLVLYLCLMQALPLVPYALGAFGIEAAALDATFMARVQASLDPFTALGQVLDPPLSVAGELGSAARFSVTMLAVSTLLNGLAIWKLRVWNPSGEPIMQREVFGAKPTEPERIHAAPGKVRPVWANPILWREVLTRAYGRRPLLVKTAYFVVLGLVCYYALFTMPPGEFAAAYGLVPIGILSLLLISAQAVTAITSERDLGALDLLLITDLSPREFIFGKILGILYNTKEYIIPPLVLIVVYAIRTQLGSAPRGQPDMLVGKNVESALALALGMSILTAFTVMFGIHVALRSDNSRLAAISTLGTVFFLSVGTMICIYLIRINGRFEYQWLSFAGFIVAGIGGLWWVLSAERPSAALNLASALLPIAVFYTITNILIGKPGSTESSDPLIPMIVTGGAFGFAVAAMAVPLMSEFDVAVGRSSAIGE